MDLRKQYESLQFKDDFMFGVVMSDTNIAKKVLSVILAEEIPNIEQCELQKTMKVDAPSHAVRYDVYAQTPDGKKVYDVEMQTSDPKELEKRSRYYQSSSDIDFLQQGKPYRSLPETYIIFICDFDPFGKGKAVYKFENYCVEEGIPLGDKAYRIFLNTKGTTERKELQNLMTYINDNIPNDELTEEIQAKIQIARHDGQLYSSYIKEQQNTMLAEERGRAKGLAEGKVQGFAEGEAKGIFKAIIMLKNIGATVDTIINSLMTQYSMSKDEATKKVNEVLSQS